MNLYCQRAFLAKHQYFTSRAKSFQKKLSYQYYFVFRKNHFCMVVLTLIACSKTSGLKYFRAYFMNPHVFTVFLSTRFMKLIEHNLSTNGAMYSGGLESISSYTVTRFKFTNIIFLNRGFSRVQTTIEDFNMTLWTTTKLKNFEI